MIDPADSPGDPDLNTLETGPAPAPEAGRENAPETDPEPRPGGDRPTLRVARPEDLSLLQLIQNEVSYLQILLFY